MSKTLDKIAEELRDANKKIQLLYAFNGTGKTRLSREFRLLIDPKDTGEDEDEQEPSGIKIMYYNAFTEDLFYWDNDLDADTNRKLIIRPNGFTNLALPFLKDQGLDNNIATNFQRYTSDKITPIFNEDFSEVSFSFTAGGDSNENNIKISKGEESNFIWCVFFSLLEEIIQILNEADLSNRSTDIFEHLEYIFIDDPVSSLDDNHLIELAVIISKLVKRSESNLKFIISTHNPLFYNVISNELNTNILNPNFISKQETPDIEKWIYHVDKHSLRYIFNKYEDGRYDLNVLGRKTPFSYHLQLLREIQTIKNTPNLLKKYHLNFLRNILEKTATFLGRSRWEHLLPKVNGEPDPHLNRLLNLSSHSAHAGEEIGELQENDRGKLIELVKYLESNYKFSELIQQNEAV
ncbi:AAA domain-containing protein [Nonlabens sp. Hel1_33_55]|uniref:AAA family ATPase n=1 Tax=Nonlabens sp. Hel1_33_55 TaxID=1336802 RepID=UPI000875B0A3|nr:AAA family ATPase [Nonlabens sp. Hel1_33_55]SCY19315.1 AAA domain-containing protein [Nonlabens sp. Hel1_33_55]